MPPAGAPRRDAVAALIVGAAAAVIAAVRIPFALYDVVWAEDANVFLLEALGGSPWSLLFHGYAGYQHLLPRLITGAIVETVPLAGYAIAVTVVSVLLAGAVAGASVWLSRDVIGWIPARIALGAITVLLPLVAQEVLGNLANLHTLCMWLVLWILFSRPRSTAASWWWGAIVLLCALTEVQTIAFIALLPFLGIHRDRRRLPMAGALLLGAVVQLVTVATVERDARAAWIGVDSLLTGWLVNTVMPLLNANPGSVRVWLENTGLVVPVLLLAPFLAATAVVVARGSRTQRLLLATLWVLSFVVYAAGAIADGSELFRYAESGAQLWERGVNARYGVMSGWALAATILLAASAVRENPWPHRLGWQRAAAWAAVIGLLAVFAVAATRSYHPRVQVPPWSPAVVGMAAGCQGMDPAAAIPLPVAPDRVVFLSCAQLTGSD
jgi:hypothetical protein